MNASNIAIAVIFTAACMTGVYKLDGSASDLFTKAHIRLKCGAANPDNAEFMRCAFPIAFKHVVRKGL